MSNKLQSSTVALTLSRSQYQYQQRKGLYAQNFIFYILRHQISPAALPCTAIPLITPFMLPSLHNNALKYCNQIHKLTLALYLHINLYKYIQSIYLFSTISQNSLPVSKSLHYRPSFHTSLAIFSRQYLVLAYFCHTTN